MVADLRNERRTRVMPLHPIREVGHGVRQFAAITWQKHVGNQNQIGRRDMNIDARRPKKPQNSNTIPAGCCFSVSGDFDGKMEPTRLILRGLDIRPTLEVTSGCLPPPNYDRPCTR